MTDVQTPAPKPKRGDGEESRRHMLIRRILTTVVVFACIALLVVAAQHTRRGDEEDPSTVTGVQGDSAVQLTAPASESSVLNQAQVLIDLNVNYDATMSIQGVAIPDNQLQKTPATGVIAFTPGPGKALEKLPQGRVCATANVFRIDGTVEDPHTVTWCFNVT